MVSIDIFMSEVNHIPLISISPSGEISCTTFKTKDPFEVAYFSDAIRLALRLVGIKTWVEEGGLYWYWVN